MSHQERSSKITKQLRQKAQDYLSFRKNRRLLEDILDHFDSGADLHSCLLALELIFTTLLKDKDMYIEVVPLKPVERTPEIQHKEWLRKTYEQTYTKILNVLEGTNPKVQTQALSTAMSILSAEGKSPLESKGSFDSYVPLLKLKSVLLKILSNKQDGVHIINKYTEYLQYDDILFFTWKMLLPLTAKFSPSELYIINYLRLLHVLEVGQNNETKTLCRNDNCYFSFDEHLTKKILNKAWHYVMHWEHTQKTQKELLIVLLERVLNHLEKPLLMTDFLMDSLDVPGAVSLLALQGIFILIRDHNLDYSNIFGKLYSMFEPEIFHDKHKARLFSLSDVFLSSTHLPETLVAAFAKRLARLALIAPSEDVIAICNFIGNLILRHPGLKCLLNNADTATSMSDPYVMEERDPLKSNAINSSLWEIRTLQQHVQPSVAFAAQFVNSPLPSVEWDLDNILGKTGDSIFEGEMKKFNKLISLRFEKPQEVEKHEKVLQYWNL